MLLGREEGGFFLGAAHREFNDVADEATLISIVPTTLGACLEIPVRSRRGPRQKWKELLYVCMYCRVGRWPHCRCRVGLVTLSLQAGHVSRGPSQCSISVVMVGGEPTVLMHVLVLLGPTRSSLPLTTRGRYYCRRALPEIQYVRTNNIVGSAPTGYRRD